jgi:hypothetical protein
MLTTLLMRVWVSSLPNEKGNNVSRRLPKHAHDDAIFCRFFHRVQRKDLSGVPA